MIDNRDYLNYRNSNMFTILVISLTLCLFVISSFNYQNTNWFHWLLGSRIFLVFSGLITTFFVYKNVFKNIHWATIYLTTCMVVQASQGVIEDGSKTDFYGYVGIIFLLIAISFKGNISIWKKYFSVFHISSLTVPLFFKDASLLNSPSNIVDNFSLIIVSTVIGLVILKVNSDKFTFIKKYTNAKQSLIQEKENALKKQININSYIKSELDKAKGQIKKEAGLEALLNISSQVAHDIRSPLSALDMMMKDMSALPEDKRLIIRSSVTRIQDIANDLLTKNRQLKRNEDLSEIENKTEKVLLSSIIETLLSEKRIQFRPKVNISIESKLGEQAYGIFAEINSREFKRVLSNLINNAVEAFKHDSGHVEVSLKSHDDKSLLLSIKDNGSGIPKEILAKLGQRGETHGKIGGSGLGLYHAKSMIESWKGNLTIESSVGEGTIIYIMLPKSTPPKTFIPQITLHSDMTVVAIDDDNSIHQIWKGRLESVKASESNISLFSFSGIDEFNKWAQNNEADLYLVDYEFIGNKLCGIDLIKKWNLQDKAILVTSRYEEKNTISACKNLKLKLLPKGLAGFIPFSVEEEAKVEEKKSTSVLLDDDMLIRMTWQMSAKEKNIDLEIFETPKQLFDSIDQFSSESTFYIDSNLSNGQKGEDVAKTLSQAGFTNLYLATGCEAEQFEHYNFLKGVIGKEAPWQ